MKAISEGNAKAREAEEHITRQSFSASCLSHKPLTRDISASAEMQILERRGKVYTAVVPNVKAKTLLKHIKEKTKKGSVYYTDTFRSYNSLIIYGKHERIDHTKTLVEYNKHINGIEGFWSFGKERFMKYHGINRDNYYWYLKGMEFRFNYRYEDLFKLLVKLIIGGNLVRK